jgi:hypothetical protein
MTRLLQWLRLARAMGWRYVFFRVGFEIRRKSGLLKSAFPVNPPVRSWITLDQWRVSAPLFFFGSRKDIQVTLTDALREKATRILDCEVQFFNGEWMKLAADDWLTNPVTGHRYDATQHWTTIPDFNPVFGDIKYVWERSRFAFLQTILRYDAASGLDSSEWVLRQIESWIDHNPINCGPNYRCSQETSLRVFNWTLALYYYRDSPSLTEERFQKILFHIYWQLKHVRSNIHFSRIAVRNNHAITETLALYTAGLLFPFFEEAREWKASGKKWFEEEIAYQVYEDGTYLQFSFNYHRVVLQLLTWAIALTEKHNEKFTEIVYQRAHASLNVLMHSQDPVSGQLPNYGANDGSLFFQWNDFSFRDYSPALDALHFLLSDTNAYSHSYEDRIWYGITKGLKMFAPIGVTTGTFSFKNGGIYGYRTNDLLCWIVCTNYKDRPSQADALHFDLWYQGRNLLQDAGSYRYNTEMARVNYFVGTESHNTLMLGKEDQMLKGPRFIWLDWSQAKEATWTVTEHEIIFRGIANVYRYKGNITHAREVRIYPKQTRMVITDTLRGMEQPYMRQLWHVNPMYKQFVSFHNDDTAVLRKEYQKFASPTYGVLEDSLQVEFQTKYASITTEIIFS